MSYFKHKERRLSFLLLLVISLILVNILSYRFFVRVDLTSDKRHSIHPTTKTLLSKLQDEVSIKIYLSGDLPIGFRQLQRATVELINTLKAYAKYPIQYEIIDINKLPIEDRKPLYKKLANKGIQPTNLYVQEQGQRIQKIIYPGALIQYQDQELGILLLKGYSMTSAGAMVAQSIDNLAYELSQAIAKLLQTTRAKIGVITSHGTPKLDQMHGLLQALKKDYEVNSVGLNTRDALKPYQALLLIKPQTPVSETEKYILDQYIMQGGKVLFFLDRLRIDMENLQNQKAFALPLDVNLDDQLFKYGIRIKQDLVQDLYAGVYPIIVGKLGNQPQLQFLPWLFFPILNNFADHIITKNLSPIYSQFANSLEVIQTHGVHKTPLVSTSLYSRSLGMPVQVDLASLRKAPDKALYNQGPIPIVYLLEGAFNSLYKNRLLPEGFDAKQHLEISKPTKIFVAGTSSLVLNAIDPREHRPLPWGYDPFMKQTFANEAFVCNALSYMLADDGLINAKNKTIQLRYLDKIKVDKYRLRWQLMNIMLPILFVLLIGLIGYKIYVRKYTRF